MLRHRRFEIMIKSDGERLHLKGVLLVHLKYRKREAFFEKR